VRSCSFAGYGAWELKRSYQRNLGEGFLLATFLHLLIIGGLTWPGALNRNTLSQSSRVIRSLVELGPPPTITEIKKQIAIALPEIAPTLGLPTPVADFIMPTVSFPTQEELTQSVPSPVTGTSESLVISIQPDEMLPKIGEFVPYEKPPGVVTKTPPIYPDLARIAGVEGDVYLDILVDKEGRVRDVQVIRASGTNVGFEEAAVEAVKKWTFFPAIQNGKPVACWLTQPIKFQVK